MLICCAGVLLAKDLELLVGWLEVFEKPSVPS
jgi:hypothetical protein